jgi:hypothetical protein
MTDKGKKPADHMRAILVSIKYARMHMAIDGAGADHAIECLIDAVESLANCIAEDREQKEGQGNEKVRS